MSFNPDQPRDYHGRWGGGGNSPASAAGHADKVANSPAFKALFKGSGGNGLTRGQQLSMYKSMTKKSPKFIDGFAVDKNGARYSYSMAGSGSTGGNHYP